MNDSFDDELRRSLNTRADAVPRIPDLSRGAIRQARDIRRRRRIAGGIAAAALVAVALPLGLKIGDVMSHGQDPIERPLPVGPTRVELDLQTLSGGDEPALPYLAGRTVVGVGFEIDVPGTAPIAGIAPVDDGVYVATGDGVPGLSLARYSSTGDTEDLGLVQGTPVASTDGRWVTYLTSETDEHGNASGPATLVLVDDESGEQSTVSLPHADASQVHIHAVSDGTVYLSYDDRRTGRAVPLQSWSVGDPAPEPVAGDFDATAVSPGGNMVAALTRATDSGACSAVADRTTDSPLWRTCDYLVQGFTPDGDYVWAVPSNTEGYGPSAIAILDAETGALVRHYHPASPVGHPITFSDAVFEDDEHLLVRAEQDDSTTLMRCEVLTEECRAAEPLVEGTGDRGAPPYLLPDVR